MNAIRALKFALPLSIILGLAIAYWFKDRDARICQTSLTRTLTASEVAGARQDAADLARNARSSDAARTSDENHQAALTRANIASERRIARGVRASHQCAVGGSAPVQADHPADLAEQPAPGTAVAVTPEYVTACGANAAYGRSAYDWAADMVSQGLALPGPGVE